MANQDCVFYCLQIRKEICHAFARGAIGQLTHTGTEIIDHMMCLAGCRNNAGYRRVPENEFKKKLRPACREWLDPAWQLLAGYGPEQSTGLKRPVDEHGDTEVLGRG